MHSCCAVAKSAMKRFVSSRTYFGLRRAAVPLSRDLISTCSTSSRSMNARHQSRSVSNVFLWLQWLLKMQFTSKIVLKSFEVHLVMRSQWDITIQSHSSQSKSCYIINTLDSSTVTVLLFACPLHICCQIPLKYTNIFHCSTKLLVDFWSSPISQNN